MSIANTGTLIMGKNGSGKSSLALSLIRLGHQLIADDAPEFFADVDNNIIGKCPAKLQDHLFIQSLGLINVRALYGDNAITAERKLAVIISLCDNLENKIQQENLYHPMQEKIILNCPIPEITLNKNLSNLSILVECAVKNFQLQQQGYYAHTEFINNLGIHNEC